MALETIPFDPSEFIDTTESQVDLLQDALESGHLGYLADALEIVARARGMTQIAQEAGIPREALYEAIGAAGGGPRQDALAAIVQALGVKLTVAAWGKPRDFDLKTPARWGTQPPTTGV
jgi:probable addiction module antidote protein